jgi:carbon monoxide dehydrogenase subunit G
MDQTRAMTVFSAAKRSTAVVPYPREAVWAVLSDARQVARLTPMVRSIEDQGATWLWKLAPIEVLGKSVGLSFTEKMDLDATTRIEFTHAPRGEERAGVEGTYELDEQGSGTRLSIDLGVHVDLPFPRLAKVAVQASMQAVIAAMGAGFAHNLDRHLRTLRTRG